MKNRSRITWLLVIFLKLGITAFAESYTSGDFTYSYVVGSGEASLRKYSGSDASVSIPSSFTVKVGTDQDDHDKFETFHVTEIYPGAFKGNTTIASVSWPSGLKVIGGSWGSEGAYGPTLGGAFQGCTNLSDIPSLSGIEKIGLSAFEGCTSLISVEIPETIKSLEMSAFGNCKGLKTAFVDGAGISMPSGLFAGCTSLENLILGDGITGIQGEFNGYVTYASRPLSSCYKLKSISLGRGITVIPESFIYGLSLVERVTSSGVIGIIKNNAFNGCANLVEIPSLSGVTDIGTGAFYNCSGLSGSLDISKSEQIGQQAFLNCTGILSVQFGENLTSIGSSAFSGCTSASTFAFAGAPPSVGSSAFSNVKNGAIGTYVATHAAAWNEVIDENGYWNGLKMVESGTFYVTFDPNGGKLKDDIPYLVAQDFSTGIAQELIESPFCKEGYDFKGWAETSDGPKKYDDRQLVSFTEDKELFAIWEKRHDYFLKFDANTGEGTMPDLPLEYGEKVRLPSPSDGFKKDGYSFVGWGIQKDLNVIESSDGILQSGDLWWIDDESLVGYPPDGQFILFAIWSKDVTVHLIANGGEDKTNSENTELTQVFPRETPQKLMKQPFKRGDNKFLGWSTTPSVDLYYELLDRGRKLEDVLVPDEEEWCFYFKDDVTEVTLYAIWTTTVSYTFYNQETTAGEKSVEPADLGTKLSWGYYDLDKFSPNSYAPSRIWKKHGESAELYPGKHLIAFKIEDGYDWMVNVENIKSENINVYSQASQYHTPGTSCQSDKYYKIEYAQGKKWWALVRFVYGCESRQTLQSVNVPFFDPAKVSITVYPLSGDYETGGALKMGNDFTSVPLGEYIAYANYERDSWDAYWSATPSSVKFSVKENDGFVSVPINFTLTGTSLPNREYVYVKFDACKGSTPVGEIQYPKATNGEAAIINQLPGAERKGFSFLGWWTEPQRMWSTLLWGFFDSGRRVEIGDAMKSSCTLYARWGSDGEPEVEYERLKGFTLNGATAVVIPKNVSSIASGAFIGCGSVSDVEFEGNAPQLEEGALEGLSPDCTIHVSPQSSGWGVTMPGMWNGLRIERIGDELTSGAVFTVEGGVLTAVELNGATEVVVPADVTSIGDGAFRGLGLTKLTIGSGVTSIHDSAFEGCDFLVEISVDPGNPVFCSKNGMLLTKDGKTLVQGVNGDVVIPSGVIVVGDSAFYGCSGLKSVTIPNSVTTIEDVAFGWCGSLVSVTIPDSVTNVGADAFLGCSSLTSATIGDGVVSLGWGAFEGCNDLLYDTKTVSGVKIVDGWAVGYTESLPSVLDLSGIRGIGDGAFCGCSVLTNVIIPDGVKSVGEYAFCQCCELTDVTIPGSVAAIGYYAFGESENLANVVMGVGVEEIGAFAFRCCSGMSSLTLPISVTDIGEWAFADTELTSMTIPPNVARIGGHAFYRCYKLSDLIITGTISSIGQDALGGCFGLTNIVIHGNAPGIDGDIMYYDVGEDCVVRVRRDSTGWGVGIPGIWNGLKIEYIDGESPLEPTTFTVVFDANGGMGGTTRIVTSGAVIGSLPMPTRSGYTFDGWFTMAAGGAQVTATTKVAANVTYYAHWTVNGDGPPPGPIPEPKPEPVIDPADQGLYMVVDLSGGTEANVFPVTYLGAVPSGGWTDEYKTTKLVLRRIHSGSFVMGSSKGELGRGFGEAQHNVTLTMPFYAGVFEVTRRQWELVMGQISGSGYGDGRHPASGIAFEDVRGSLLGSHWPESSEVDATSFMGVLRAKTGLPCFDLPTEAQWEYACRAGTITALNSGKNLSKEHGKDNNLAEVANYCLSYRDSPKTVVVGSLIPNAWGLYDMHGSMSELCLDWIANEEYSIRWFDLEDAVDPVGEPSSAGWTYRAMRGGDISCGDNGYLRSAARDGAEPSRNASTRWGFRVFYPLATEEEVEDDPIPAEDDEYKLYSVVADVAPAVASEYNGYLYDEKGNVKGTIQVKVGKPGKKDGKAAVKASIVLGAKKVTLKAAEKGKAVISAYGPTDVVLVGGETCAVVLGAAGISGTYGSYFIDGARNFFASKDKAEQAAANAVLGKWLGPVSVVWNGGSLGVSIAAKGKVKVKGTLANGTKVSAKSVFLVGEEWCAVPVAAPKVNLAFALWLSYDGRTAIVEGLGDGAIAGKPGALAANAAFHVAKDAALWSSISGTVLTDYIPDGIKVASSGGKWVLPKAGKVVYKDGVVDESKLGENPSGLKLAYKVKDGSFKGSFKVYAVNSGKAKSTTVNVTGVMVGATGHGAATIKGKGSVKVTIK